MLTLLLLCLALLPPLLFFLRIFGSDAREPEPYDMILFAIGLGIISTFPASIIEGLLDFFPVFGREGFLGAAVTSFIQVAPVEEGCKLAVILLFIWKNRNFNEENDGIVYVTLSAIGFALFENIMYVFDGGLELGVQTSIVRGITSIPLHTFCGVLMGYYVGRARFAATRKETNVLILKGFVIAWFIHGLYDTFAMAGSGAGLLVIPLIIILFYVGNKFIKNGKALSEARWDDPECAEQIKIDTPSHAVQRAIGRYGEDKISIDGDGRYFLKPERQIWKAIIGLLLIIGSVFFWGLLQYFIGETGDEYAVSAVVEYSILSTSVPVVLGIMLLVSYRRRLGNNYYF